VGFLEQARAWAMQDPDLETKAELEALIENQNFTELEARFESRLQFGTAGLRGELGAGPNRMNRIVVARTALAISQFLNQNKSDYLNPEGELSVVIGYDGRKNSDIFARDSAEIFSAAGIRALLFDQNVPTPVAAFTGRRLRSSATIVVTASHNPPRDNGYKVYLGGKNGQSQLNSPQDSKISALMDEISVATSFDQIPKTTSYQLIGEAEILSYRNRSLELISPQNPARQNLLITYTAMHGVGYKVIAPIFEAAGFDLKAVAAQRDPDQNFPTVSFPNPEEPGAMDLAFEHAKQNSSDLIIANDPDADRLAVGVRTDSDYQMLTGDQVGLLLAEIVAKTSTQGTLANSIVSADISKVARKYGLDYTQTLTGFKWISKVPNLVFGYEEALGYCVDPDHTPDKDGITAALLIAELAADLKTRNQNLRTYLDELAKDYGHIATGQVSLRVTDLSIIAKIMDGLRSSTPELVLNQSCKFEDLSSGENLPPTDGIILSNEAVRVIIRPSGTEPKLKCYLQYQGKTQEEATRFLEDLKLWAKDLLQDLS